MDNIIVFCAAGEYRSEAEKLAERLGCGITFDKPENDLFLYPSENGISLCAGELELKADFMEMASRLKPNNLGGELLVKAARFRNGEGKTAVDATAGFGSDSFLLAASGYDVTMFEYNPVIAVLLEDALMRAADIPVIADVCARMTLVGGDSISGMRSLAFNPDVILLDPMFPERQKSGLIKKKFQLIHRLEAPCTDEKALFESAKDASPRRIIVKRPAKGEYLDGLRPSYSITGNAVRYDCYAF